jgi:cell division topological specificity factor
MKLFQFFNRGNSAPVARERLQILLAHERRSACNPDLLALLHKEVLHAISKHVAIDHDRVEVKIHRREDMSVLEIDIELQGNAIEARAPSTKDERAA